MITRYISHTYPRHRLIRLTAHLYIPLLVLILQGSIELQAQENLSFDSYPSYALFFAGNQYEQMHNLQNPISDATQIEKRLVDSYGFTSEIVRNPSLEDLERKLAEYEQGFANETLKPEGQLLIYFSGHGAKEFTEGYFITRDGDPDRLRQTALPFSYLRDLISSFKCKHILVAIDACYSLTFDRNWENIGRASTSSESVYPQGQDLFEQHLTKKSRLFFTSDGEGDQTPDKSSFAKQFQEGLLRPLGTDRMLTHTDVFASLKRAIPVPHEGEFKGNEPGATFLFIEKVPTFRPKIEAKVTLDSLSIPRGLHHVEVKDGFILRHPNFDWLYFIGSIFTLLFGTFMSLGFINAIWSDAPSKIGETVVYVLKSIPALIPFILSTAFFLQQILNKTDVYISDEQVYMRTYPIPNLSLSFSQRDPVPSSSIKRISIEKETTYDGRSNSETYYHLKYENQEGTEDYLFKNILYPKYAKYYKQEIERHLGIVNPGIRIQN